MRWRGTGATELAQSEAPQTPIIGALDDSDDVTSSAIQADESTTASGLVTDSSTGVTYTKPTHSRLDSDGEEEDELFADDDDDLSDAAASTRSKKRQHPSSSSADDDDDPGDSFPLNIHNEDGMDHSQPPPDDENSSIEWRPQTSQSTCEFTHTILNYSQKRESGCKKAEYSATTVDEFGNRWRLIVYVNGNGRASNHHLSLFLQVADADDLPFGWKKAVSYVLTLEHPSGNNLSYAKRNPDKTFKLCPKAIDWGWSQFITSDRIQQEGFIQDDSLTVRACVTVKSSSVTIDADDAELYLKCAVEEGNVEGVKLCLSQGAGVNCQFKDDLYTPLHTACSSASPTSTSEDGNMQVLELLLEKGADGNACNKWRETPLLIAANNGHRAAVEALLKHGADPSLCSEAGWSALTFAAHKGYDDIVSLLLRAGAPVNCRVTEDSSTPLHKACAGSKPGHLTAVKQLLDGGADVHALNKWRETPLLTAANHGQAGAVDALLKAGADPCKCTDTGWSPLSIAAYKGHDDVVKLLLEEGAPTEEADPTLSALLQAATKGLPGTVELLLRHGADHTVTTKKGDTALSILVEQNLIDAAVEMVTEYKASVPRCSRDRKKVQRARLLINLRIKQMQRDGTYRPNDGSDDEYDVDDDAETDQEDGVEFPQHGDTMSVDSGGINGKSVSPRKKKKKGGKNKVSAEEQAKKAEEALLLELEQEIAQAEKVQHEASKKSAKKKKKKERERLQKQKEEEARREKENKERREKDRIRQEKEDLQRQEREEKAKVQREKDMTERKKVMEVAAKRREKEEKERKRQLQAEKQRKAEQLKIQQQQQQQQQQKAQAVQVSAKQNKAKQTKKPPILGMPQGARTDVKIAPLPTAVAQRSVSTSAVPTQKAMLGKNRGWETKAKPATPQHIAALSPKSHTSGANSPVVVATSTNGPSNPVLTRSTSDFQHNSVSLSNGPQGPQLLGFNPPPASVEQPGNPFGELSSLLSVPQSNQQDVFGPPSTSAPLANGYSRDVTPPPQNPGSDAINLPAAVLFRHEKVIELMSRFSMTGSPASTNPLQVVGENTAKVVIYRWIVRAAHDTQPCLDTIIPSWTDSDHLATFFQRQFISESRKGSSGASQGGSMVSMEALKEAGSAMASLCQSLAKEVVEFQRGLDAQLPRDWSDGIVGMGANDAQNGSTPQVIVNWANRSQVSFSVANFSKLSKKYIGPSNRLLSCFFCLKATYDTMGLIVSGTEMDCGLTPSFQRAAANEVKTTMELWTNPLETSYEGAFWGQFPTVDSPFGGSAPFSKEGGNDEELLARHGGSVLVLPPMDNMVSSRYLHKIVNALQAAEHDRIPLSFLIILRTECFHDRNNAPMPNDLHLLDPRLGDQCRHYVRGAEPLAAGQHMFTKNDGSVQVCNSGSLLAVLQNPPGTQRYHFNDMSLSNIISALGIPTQQPQLANQVNFSSGGNGSGNEFDRSRAISSTGSSDFLDSFAPLPNSGLNPSASEFGAIGGLPFSNAFSTASVGHDLLGSNTSSRRPANPSRRLFDLVDDNEDTMNDVDVVSGMLNNLNVDLFQRSGAGGQDVDIEAISLMGIGAPDAQGAQRNGSRGRFG